MSLAAAAAAPAGAAAAASPLCVPSTLMQASFGVYIHSVGPAIVASVDLPAIQTAVYLQLPLSSCFFCLLLCSLCRGSGAVFSALSSGISYILPRSKPAAGSSTAAAAAVPPPPAAAAAAGSSSSSSSSKPTRSAAAGARLTGQSLRPYHSSFGETTAPIPVPAVRVGPPQTLGTSLRPLLQQKASPFARHLQLQQQQQQQQQRMYSMPPRSQSLTSLPSYGAQQLDPVLQQQLEKGRHDAWQRLTSAGRIPAAASFTPQTARLQQQHQLQQQLSHTVRPLRGNASVIQLPDIPQPQQQPTQQPRQQQ